MKEKEEIQYSGRIFLKLKSIYYYLGKAEKKVATFIKNYPEEVTKLSINVMANKVGVSVSTIIRVCRKVGVEGYTDLKMELVKDMADMYKNTFIQITSDENYSSLYEKASKTYINTINNTFRLLSEDALKNSINSILNSKFVLCMGIGSSGALAKLLCHKLLKLDIICSWSNDFSDIPLLINNIGEGSILFAISHTSSTSDMYENTLGMAKEMGCTTILLTNYKESPMAKATDIILTTAVDENSLGSEGGTKSTGQLSVINFLCLLIALKKQGVL